MKPSIASLALAALLAAPVWAPASIPTDASPFALPDASASAVQSAEPTDATLLLERRGEATVQHTLDRLGFPTLGVWRHDAASFADFFHTRDASSIAIVPIVGLGTDIYSLSPSDRDAYFALYASESWSNEPDTPEGWQVFTPPSRAFTNYVASVNDKLVASESPVTLQAALDLLPTLPALLPAEGDLVAQIDGDNIALLLGGGPTRQAIPRNVATFTAGLGLDGDTAALQTVVAPVPGSKLADFQAGCAPIPPATACVNLPGALAFYAEGPCPDLRDLFPDAFDDDPVATALERYSSHQPASFAFFPPASPGCPRALAYTGINDPAALRAALLDLLSRRADAIAVATDASHRDVPVDTLSIADPIALQDLLATQFGPNPQYALIPYIQQALDPTLSLAWLPDALLVAFNDADSALLHPALDALLDGGLSARQFEQSPAFQSAFPYPDAPAHALAHLDLDALLPAYSIELPLALPTPCPLDLFAYIASDASLVLRLRAPADLVQTLAGLASAIPGGAGGPPAESEDAGDPPATKTPNP